jgi:hypothetical protein
MSIMGPEVVFPQPWSDLRGGGHGEDKQREVLHVELSAELVVGHVLYGRAFSIIARSEARDDVVITLEDDLTWALVHLTWRGTPERPPWPLTVFFPTLKDAVDAMQK